MTTTSAAIRATAAVVALKSLEQAKSRLAVADPLRRRLAWTMALDTLRALASVLPQVLVVSDQPALESDLRRAGLSVSVLGDSSRVGMNAALDTGAEALRGQGFTTVLACVGDLPALRSESIIKVLRAAERSDADRAFLSDASGIGTTMLIGHDTPLAPRFQGRSAAAHHSSGAINLAGTSLGPVPDAQRDVDTEIELQAAQALGLGPATRALVDHETGRLGRHQVITATQWRSPDGQQQAVTAAGRRVALPAAVLAEGLRQVRSGQRLHAVIADDDRWASGVFAGRVLSAWLY